MEDKINNKYANNNINEEEAMKKYFRFYLLNYNFKFQRIARIIEYFKFRFRDSWLEEFVK